MTMKLDWFIAEGPSDDLINFLVSMKQKYGQPDKVIQMYYGNGTNLILLMSQFQVATLRAAGIKVFQHLDMHQLDYTQGASGPTLGIVNSWITQTNQALTMDGFFVDPVINSNEPAWTELHLAVLAAIHANSKIYWVNLSSAGVWGFNNEVIRPIIDQADLVLLEEDWRNMTTEMVQTYPYKFTGLMNGALGISPTINDWASVLTECQTADKMGLAYMMPFIGQQVEGYDLVSQASDFENFLIAFLGVTPSPPTPSPPTPSPPTPSNCFIATAAGMTEPELKELRAIRDLAATFPDGKTIVDFYYAKAPKYIELVKANPELQKDIHDALELILTGIHRNPLIANVLAI